MLNKSSVFQLKPHIITIEGLVPENHIVRKIDRMIDFSFTYPLVEDLYCKDNTINSIGGTLIFYIFNVGSATITHTKHPIIIV